MNVHYFHLSLTIMTLTIEFVMLYALSHLKEHYELIVNIIILSLMQLMIAMPFIDSLIEMLVDKSIFHINVSPNRYSVYPLSLFFYPINVLIDLLITLPRASEKQ
ncbi:hypothetical protein ACJX0J_038662, partial [Zea mays]